MLRIVICSNCADNARQLFDFSRAILKSSRISGELLYTSDHRKVLNNISECANYYDILFLDADDKQCLSAAEAVRSKNLTASLIFICGENDLCRIIKYRPSAVIHNISDPEQISDALKFACAEQQRIKPYFIVRNKDVLMRINYSDIYFFESQKRIVTAHTLNKDIEFYAKLDNVQAALPENEFVRCHQSFIVNMNAVSRLDKAERCFYTASGVSIAISKSLYPQVSELYERFAACR